MLYWQGDVHLGRRGMMQARDAPRLFETIKKSRMGR